MGKDLGDKTNDCPLPVVDEDVLRQFLDLSSRFNPLYAAEYVTKMQSENPILVNELLRYVSTFDNETEVKFFLSGACILYELLRSQALKD